MNACRNVLANAPRERAAHAGLLLNRYLRVPVKDSHHPDDLKQLFNDARSASKSATALYQSAFDRWRSSLDADTRSCDWLEMQTNGRVVVGLGTETVCETGIALHRIYGVPWIPGAALKGITAHFAHEVASQTDARLLFNGEAHRVIFGDQDAAGYIVFHDAWITPDSLPGLYPDIMTPHHPDYYTNENHPVPTDYDSPVPVGFLSVHGKFCFAVGTYDTSDSGKAWRQLSLDLLRFALIERGVGGKTSSGYGRFSAPEVATASAASTILHPRSKKAPLYKVGNRVTATRIPDPKGKGRIWFRADDEFSGVVTAGASPSVEIGQTVELEIASIMAAQGYNFRLPRVSPPSAKSHSDKRTTHR